MSPPAQENWVREEFRGLHAKIDKGFADLSKAISAHGERVAVVETEIRTIKSGSSGILKWLGGAIIAVGSWALGKHT